MIFNKINSELQHSQTIDHVTDIELDSLIQKYPFAQALRLLKAKRTLQSSDFSQNTFIQVLKSGSLGLGLLDRVFTINPINIQYSTALDEQIANESDYQESDNKQTQEANIVTDNKAAEENQELAHLSDYSAWLLQLKMPSIHTSMPTRAASTVQMEEAAEDEKPVTILDNSSQLKQEIVSESLANLLAEQGHVKKAVEMYAKLSMIIPERSEYFDAQIRKLNDG